MMRYVTCQRSPAGHQRMHLEASRSPGFADVLRAWGTLGAMSGSMLLEAWTENCGFTGREKGAVTA